MITDIGFQLVTAPLSQLGYNTSLCSVLVADFAGNLPIIVKEFQYLFMMFYLHDTELIKYIMENQGFPILRSMIKMIMKKRC